jgi:hypothetical protein
LDDIWHIQCHDQTVIGHINPLYFAKPLRDGRNLGGCQAGRIDLGHQQRLLNRFVWFEAAAV